MSIKLIDAVTESGLPTGQRFVLLILADACNDDGVCYPSQAVIERKTGMGRTTVSNHLDWLEKRGLISRERRQKGNVRKSDLYQINIALLNDLKNGKKLPECSKSECSKSECSKSECSKSECSKSEHPNVQILTDECSKSEHSLYEEPSIEPSIEPSNITQAEKPKREKSNSHETDLQTLQDLGVDKQIAKDWLQTRKEKRAGSLTQTVVAALQREAEKAGLTVAQAVQVAAERNWGRFVASYLLNEKQGFSGSLNAPSGIRPNRITEIPVHEAGVQKSTLARDVLADLDNF